jgi:flagellin
MIINYNAMASNALRQLNVNQGAQAKSMAKLSSGLRINSAADDAAGLAISEKMKGQIRGLDQASRNAQDAQSLGQTAEGALSQTTDILQRMRELATQSASDTNTSSDRQNIQQEVDQLAKETTRIANTTEFNKQNLLAGGLNDTFQIGANAGQTVGLQVNAMDAKSLGVARDINQVSAVAAGATTLPTSSIGNSDLGSGLTAQTYNLVVTHTASSVTGVTKTTAGAAAAGGTYTGAQDQANVQFRVDGTNGAAGEVTAASYSTDGGTTWTAASVDSSGADGIISYQGATITVTTNAANAQGQTVTASFNAKKDSIQLQDSTATNIGSAVTAYSNQSSITVGDAATGRTMNINSASLGSLTSGTATVTVSTQASSAAVIGANNSITTQAVAQAGIDVSSSATAASNAITTIDNAIQKVSSERAKLGAFSNRLDNTVNNLNTSSQNISDAQSRIANVDMAKEMMSQSKSSVLAQAAQAMLAMANQQPQQVLQLLR